MSTKIKTILIIVAVFTVIVAILFPFFQAIFLTKASREAQITIKPGEGTREIAQKLNIKSKGNFAIKTR